MKVSKAFFVVVAVIVVGVVSYLAVLKFTARDSTQIEQGPQAPDVVQNTAPSPAPSVDTSKNTSKTNISVTALGIGTSGNRVANLQKFLSQFREIYPEGLVTGYFGPLTEEAVKRFQKRENIEATGIVGPETLKRLNELGLSLEEGTAATAAAASLTESVPPAAEPTATPVSDVPPAPLPTPAPAPAALAVLKINPMDQSTLPENIVGGFDTLFARFSASGGDIAINRMILVSDSVEADKNILLVEAYVVRDLVSGWRSGLYMASPTSPTHVPQSGSSPEYWWWSVDLAPPRAVPNIRYQISYVNGIGTVTTTTVSAVPNAWISPRIIAKDSSAIINIEAYCAHPARFRVGIMSVDAVSGSLFGEPVITGKPVIDGLAKPLYDRYINCIVMPDGSLRS